MGHAVTLADDLENALMDNFYDDMRERIPAATRAARAAAPNMRDLREETYVWIGSKSDNQTALIHVRCDPLAPDVGSKNKRVEYANGVDLANFTNGPASGQTRRKGKKLATFGWWNKATKAAFDQITK